MADRRWDRSGQHDVGLQCDARYDRAKPWMHLTPVLNHILCQIGSQCNSRREIDGEQLYISVQQLCVNGDCCLCTVPTILKFCSELIEMYGVVDGIYRLSGISSNIQQLRCVVWHLCFFILLYVLVCFPLHMITLYWAWWLQTAVKSSLNHFRVFKWIFLLLYRVGQKKLHNELMAITLSILNGFSKFFHCWKAK